MNPYDLTDQDLDVLLEAVDCWEKEKSVSDVMGMMFGAMLSRSKEEAEQRLQHADRLREAHQGEDRLRKERATLLKAKLIQLRQALAAERLGGTER